MPSDGSVNRPRSTCDLGCRVHRTVTVAAQVATTLIILVVMAPLARTVGVVSSPLVRSCKGVDVANVHEPDVEEPFVEEPSHSRRDLAGSSAGWRFASVSSGDSLFCLYSKVKVLITYLEVNFVELIKCLHPILILSIYTCNHIPSNDDDSA
jgi:hypothetical protein